MMNLRQRQDRVAFLDYLCVSNLIDSENRERVLTALSKTQQPVDVVITELGLLSDEALASAFNAYGDMDASPTEVLKPDTSLIEQVGLEFLQDNALLPLQTGTAARLIFAAANPLEEETRQALEFALEAGVELVAKPRRQIHAALQDLHSALGHENSNDALTTHNELTDADMDRLHDVASEAPVVRFVIDTIEQAVSRRATDIHIEPQQDKILVRCRVDGLLTLISEAPKSLHAGIAARVKVLSQLNVAEQRRPQDGRMRVPVRGKPIDLRVSFLPTVNGETIVLRILDKSNVPLDLAALGFDSKAQQQLDQLASKPNGIVLITGPTGSGKTTTLYAMIEAIKRPELKIFTIENPVEYKLDNVVQIQVSDAIDLTFANALRSVLRQDPDIILVGEIRDQETADIAIKASLTGHLVFSTLHTNSASEAITRLKDMGIEPYLIAATVRGVIAQRLLRKCCDACKGAGPCDVCGGNGLSGRTVCYEILMASQAISRAIADGARSEELKGQAIENGMITMQDHAHNLLEENTTTQAEIERVLEIGAL